VLQNHCRRRHTDFLLERALVRRSKADPSKLIAAARSILNLILKWRANSEYFHCKIYMTSCTNILIVSPSAAALPFKLLT
jgi:hypothetical protein